MTSPPGSPIHPSHWVATMPPHAMPPSPHHSGLNGSEAAIRERLARLETSADHVHHTVRSHHDRLLAGDSRMASIETRLTDLDREGRRAIENLGKLEDMPRRLEALEARKKAMADWGKYGLAAILIALAMLGRVPWSTVLEVARKLVGLA